MSSVSSTDRCEDCLRPLSPSPLPDKYDPDDYCWWRAFGGSSLEAGYLRQCRDRLRARLTTAEGALAGVKVGWSHTEVHERQLQQEVEFYKDREKHFAKLLQVADGGQYRADWDAPLKALIKERDTLKSELETLWKVKVQPGENYFDTLMKDPVARRIYCEESLIAERTAALREQVEELLKALATAREQQKTGAID